MINKQVEKVDRLTEVKKFISAKIKFIDQHAVDLGLIGAKKDKPIKKLDFTGTHIIAVHDDDTITSIHINFDEIMEEFYIIIEPTGIEVRKGSYTDDQLITGTIEKETWLDYNNLLNITNFKYKMRNAEY